jgi:hypothetical protein
MPHGRLTHVLGSIGVLAVLAGCAPGSPPAAVRPGVCNHDAARSLIGKTRITDEEVKQLTGAVIVRQIQPGQPVIQNYTNARLTIQTDPATDRIVGASCG